MTAARTHLGLILCAAVLAAAGCEPTRARTGWVNPLDAYEAALAKDPKDNDYILQRMEFGRTAMLLGSHGRPSRAWPRPSSNWAPSATTPPPP